MKRGDTDYPWYYYQDSDTGEWLVTESGLSSSEESFSTEAEAESRVEELNSEEM